MYTSTIIIYIIANECKTKIKQRLSHSRLKNKKKILLFIFINFTKHVMLNRKSTSIKIYKKLYFNSYSTLDTRFRFFLN